MVWKRVSHLLLVAAILFSCIVLTSHQSTVLASAPAKPVNLPGLLDVPFSDNFDDNTINASMWAETEQGGPTAAEVKHRLEITIPSTSQDPTTLPERAFRAGYTSVSPLSGDFDVQVDFELLTWPTDDGIRVGIIMDENPYAWDGVQWVNVQRSNLGSSQEVYLTHLSTQGLQGITATDDLTGRLRQVRLGDTLSAYCWDSSLEGEWVLLHTWSGAPTTDLYITIQAWSHDSYFGNQDALVAFDNLAVYSGANSPPDQPDNVEPTSGTAGVSLTPTLQSSTFSDPDTGDTHAASQWQITTTAGDYSSPMFDSSTDPSHLTSMATPSLDYATAYFWRVRHQDNHGAWSDYSSETHFTTRPSLLSLPFGDNFNDNTLNSSLWVVTEQGGPTVAEVNQRLEITLPANSEDPPTLSLRGFRAGYESVAPIEGDYDVQVDFALLNWPANDGVRVGINLQPDYHAEVPQDMSVARASNFGSWDEFYVAGVASQGGEFVATSDSVGKLRQVRIGDTVSDYYWDSSLGNWALIGTWYGVSTDDMYVSLMAWSHNVYFGDQAALVAFDNLVVSAPGVNTPPNQPANALPTDGTSGVSLTPTLQSSPFSDPDTGDVHTASQWQITSTAGSYSAPVFDSGADASNLTSITVPSGKLDYSNAYYWHVRYQDSHGGWSDWSTETSFTTIDRLPTQPSNVAPGNGETGVSLTPTLEASAFSDPDAGDTHSQSHWQLATTAGDYSTPVWEITSSAELTSCAVPSGALNYSTTYYWHVSYQDQHGVWSAYSAETSFTTMTRPPDQPGAASPADGATEVSLTPTLQSTAFSDPDGDTHLASQWQITSTAGNYASPVFDSGADAEHLTEIDIASGVLGYSNLYYWRVRYQDNRESWSEWSAEASFTTLNREPNQPVNALPSNGTAGVSRTSMLQSSSFSDPDNGDTHLSSHWQITTAAGEYSSFAYDSGVDAEHLTSIQVPSGTLVYSTTYYWHVRHQDSHGTWSEWSAETSFTTAAQPRADFSIDSMKSAQHSIMVFFTNLSSGGVVPLACAWDFENDGTIDSTEWEPWHSYAEAGTHTVSLSVTDATGDTDVTVSILTLISSGGATIETPDGHVRTEFPPDAVSGAALVTMGTRDSNGLPSVPKKFTLGGTCFVIMALDADGNEIVTLAQPSVITVKYSEEDVAAAGGNPNRLVLAYWDEAAGEWEPLETTVNTEDMTLTASTTHLSTWAVLAKTNSSSGLPPWAWVFVGIGGLAVVGVLGSLALLTKRAKQR